MDRNETHVLLRWVIWYLILPAALALVAAFLLVSPPVGALIVGCFWVLGFFSGFFAIMRAMEVGLLIQKPKEPPAEESGE